MKKVAEKTSKLTDFAGMAVLVAGTIAIDIAVCVPYIFG